MADACRNASCQQMHAETHFTNRCVHGNASHKQMCAGKHLTNRCMQELILPTGAWGNIYCQHMPTETHLTDSHQQTDACRNVYYCQQMHAQECMHPTDDLYRVWEGILQTDVCGKASHKQRCMGRYLTNQQMHAGMHIANRCVHGNAYCEQMRTGTHLANILLPTDACRNASHHHEDVRNLFLAHLHAKFSIWCTCIKVYSFHW